MNRIQHILWTDVGGWTLPELYQKFGDGVWRLYETTRIWGDGSKPTTYLVWAQLYHNPNVKLYSLIYSKIFDENHFTIEHDEFGHPNVGIHFDRVGEIV